MSSQKILSKPKLVHAVLMACRWLFLSLLIWSIVLWKQTQTLSDFMGILICLHLLFSSYTLQLTYDSERFNYFNGLNDDYNELVNKFNKRPRRERRLIIKQMEKDQSI